MMQTTFQNIKESLKQLPHSLQIEVLMAQLQQINSHVWTDVLQQWQNTNPN
jgi:hypothetical protein